MTIKKDNKGGNIRKFEIDFYEGPEFDENWTEKIEYVIPVEASQKRMGYELVKLESEKDNIDSGRWKKIAEFIKAQKADSYLFLVRDSKLFDFSVQTQLRTKDSTIHEELTKLVCIFAISTQENRHAQIAKALPDDPIRKLSYHMIRELADECVKTEAIKIEQNKKAWAKQLLGLGNRFSSEKAIGIKVESIDLNVTIPQVAIKAHIDRTEPKKQAAELIKEKEILKAQNKHSTKIVKLKKKQLKNRKVEMDLEHDEKKHKQTLENELEEKALKNKLDRQKQVAKSNSDIEKEKKRIELSNRHYKNTVERFSEFKSVVIKMLDEGRLTTDEAVRLLAEPAVTGTSSEQDSFAVGEPGKQIPLAQTVFIENKAETHTQPRSQIYLQTERLPVLADVFFPPEVRVGENQKIIVSLKPESEFEEETHHKLAETWSVQLKNASLLLEGDEHIKQFKHVSKEGAYRAEFKVRWEKSDSTAIQVLILDEDDEVIGEKSLKPNQIHQ